MHPTAELIRNVRKGDRQATEELCRILLPEIRRESERFRGLMDQEDLVQESMIRILERLDTLRDDDRLVPWARRIARNTCISAIRRRPRFIEFDEDRTFEPARPESVSDRDDILVERIVAAISRLPVHLRESARQAYLLGIPQKGIASRLGIPVGTVKSRLAASRSQVRIAVERMSSELEETMEKAVSDISIAYQEGTVQGLSLRGYGLYFGSVLEVGDVEEVVFLDYPGPVPTMVVISEVRRKVRIAGTEAFEVFIRHFEVEPEEPPVMDYFSIDGDSIRWLMRASTMGGDPHLEFNDGSSCWLPTPRVVRGDRPADDMILRACAITLDGKWIDRCISCLDLKDAGSPAESIYRSDKRQILLRRYIDEGNAKKRELPWESLPVSEQLPEGVGTLRHWYDCVLVKPVP